MWTEQAVETLRRLAQEGRSAAWIAAALGAPSRNAVIGKASRIGIRLNGGTGAFIGEGPRPEWPLPPATPWGRPVSRARIRAPAVTREKRSAPMGERPRPQQAPAKIPWARSAPGARRQVPAFYGEAKRPGLRIFAAAEVGEMRRIGLTEISEVECRWPIGDPTQEDFAYCGLQVARGRAYCAGHCRLAYRSA